MKNLIALLLTFGLVVAALTACAGGATGANAPTDAAAGAAAGSPSSVVSDGEKAPEVLQPSDTQQEPDAKPPTRGGEDYKAPEPEGASLWSEIYGCWTASEDRFALLGFEEGRPVFSSSHMSGWMRNRPPAKLTEVRELGGRVYEVTAVYPPVPFGEAADSFDTQSVEVELRFDLSGLDIDGKLIIEVDGDVGQYACGGDTYEEALESLNPGDTRYASLAEVKELWGRLEGYWNASGDNAFLQLSADEDGMPLYMEGRWDAGGGRGPGRLESIESLISTQPGIGLQLVFLYPALDENHMDGPLDEYYQTVKLDLSLLETDGVLRVHAGPNELVGYVWAGDTAEAAYADYQNVSGGAASSGTSALRPELSRPGLEMPELSRPELVRPELSKPRPEKPPIAPNLSSSLAASKPFSRIPVFN